MFPGCELTGNKSEDKKCADDKMLDFIYSNLKYPAIARENSVEGTVVVQFVVEKDGSISDARILRDIGASCGQEALRLVNSMPTWIPGKQRGRPVNVQFNLPVRFKLEREVPNEIDLNKQKIAPPPPPPPPPPSRELAPPPPPGAPQPPPKKQATEQIQLATPDKAPPEGDPIFKVVEEQPRFPGCEHMADKQERQKCAQELMLMHIYKNIKYPADARKKGVEGMVVVTYIIEKDGTVSNAKVIRDIGAGCGNEAVRVVNSMPKWIPGKQRGKPVRVQYNLPVKFSLN